MPSSAIMLLGKQIPLCAVDGEAPAVIQSGDFEASSEKTEYEEGEKVTVEGQLTEETHENEEAFMDEHDSEDTETENIQPAVKSENGEIGETEQCDTNLKQKTSKKPEKILPCPRCKSMETKFCYYNNYNVNQPRYFCKACQRYWTSGGTMRNMPVGAGRRKNKNSPSAYRHITVPETLQPFRSNGKVLSFGSVTSVLSNGEKGLKGNLNGLEKIEGQGFLAPRAGHEISDDCSSVSSVTASDSNEEGLKKTSDRQYFHDLNVNPSYLPFFPAASWPYCPPGFPLSFYHGSYWNPPWFSCQPSSPSSPKKSSTIGKHSRDSDISETCNSDNGERNNQRQGSILVPKTLRIDNPNDAAKSSIWATLGIKNESISIRPGDMFKDFQSKGVEKTCLAERSSVLQANPAALTRSLTFHETA